MCRDTEQCSSSDEKSSTSWCRAAFIIQLAVDLCRHLSILQGPHKAVLGFRIFAMMWKENRSTLWSFKIVFIYCMYHKDKACSKERSSPSPASKQSFLLSHFLSLSFPPISWGSMSLITTCIWLLDVIRMWDTFIRWKTIKESVIQHVCDDAVLMAAAEKCPLQSCACKRAKKMLEKQ